MSFNGTDIRRALEAAGPTPAQLKDLTDKLEAAQAAPTRRRAGRRAVIALALCAALAVTAVAAGPSVWSALAEHLGPYAPFAREMEGTASDQGIRLELVSAVSDGYTARIFYTLTDEAGDRLNADHTKVTAQLEGSDLGVVLLGSSIVSYDADSGTLLMEAGVEGVHTSQPLELVMEKIDPASYMLWDSRFPAAVPEEPLETETTEDGDVVLKAGQNPQTSPDTDVVQISSVGFDGEGNFHIRLELAEGIDGTLVARPCNAAGEPLGTASAVPVEGGVDCLVEGFAPSDGADLAYIQVSGPYRGPEPVIEGEWTLPVELEAAEQKVIQVGRTLEDGVYVDRVEISGMNIAVFFRSEDVDWFTLWATDSTGETFGVPLKYMNRGVDPKNLSCGLWSFETPMDLEDISSVTFLGETFPLT
ncbi:hypothetical protein [Intestinimonas massiliensis (ex Afouda et al. 2020)]|uniref:hypothetical protein n=1 Tax=Intestinimonas massiliensis (ex Afouda et al. 2020) TaxID=1673721 RepID=UPI001030D529|nr:hypothetical protein [Intestinimonas massiliensis (ex Afouda et al. 2020)]